VIRRRSTERGWGEGVRPMSEITKGFNKKIGRGRMHTGANREKTHRGVGKGSFASAGNKRKRTAAGRLQSETEEGTKKKKKESVSLRAIDTEGTAVHSRSNQPRGSRDTVFVFRRKKNKEGNGKGRGGHFGRRTQLLDKE